MSEGQIIDIYNQGVSEVISLIKELSNQIKSLDSQIETLSKGNKALTERVKSLESQVNKNSNNSSHRQMVLKRKLKVYALNHIKVLAAKNVMKVKLYA